MSICYFNNLKLSFCSNASDCMPGGLELLALLRDLSLSGARHMVPIYTSISATSIAVASFQSWFTTIVFWNLTARWAKWLSSREQPSEFSHDRFLIKTGPALFLAHIICPHNSLCHFSLKSNFLSWAKRTHFGLWKTLRKQCFERHQKVWMLNDIRKVNMMHYKTQ